MKRYGFLFEQAFTKENLYLAFVDACNDKLAKRGCFNFKKQLGRNIDRLYRTLHDGTYRPAPYFSFTVTEHKKRQIYAPTFHDLVIQHAIYRVVGPIFNAAFIDQSFACRTGLGTHKAADYAQASLQQAPGGSYSIKLDIRKFFYRIGHAVLRKLIERKIKDKRFVDLMMLFASYGEPLGIPIGNLLSQLYALIVLNPLDHFIKRVLKVRKYCRYVDDFVLFGLTRLQCICFRDQIIEFIQTRLGLELSKYTIATVKRGVNFVGYRTWASRRFIRKHSLFNFHRAAKAGKLNSVISILGHARRTHSLGYLIRFLKENYHDLYCQLPQVYRRYSNC